MPVEVIRSSVPSVRYCSHSSRCTAIIIKDGQSCEGQFKAGNIFRFTGSGLHGAIITRLRKGDILVDSLDRRIGKIPPMIKSRKGVERGATVKVRGYDEKIVEYLTLSADLRCVPNQSCGNADSTPVIDDMQPNFRAAFRSRCEQSTHTGSWLNEQSSSTSKMLDSDAVHSHWWGDVWSWL